ncbi:MAG: PilZ domain-containing protein [Gammaproteobacteria bacterium]
MNTESPSDPLGEGIVYADRHPLTWEQLSAPPAAEELARWNAASEQVLRLVAALEDHWAEPIDEPYGPQGHELARLDFKLNLVLELVSQLVRRQVPMPERREIRLNGNGVQWESTGDAPPDGSHVRVFLHLHDNLPRALELPGRVVERTPTDAGECVTVRFEGLSESVQDLLDKLIFRHHRRSIAHSRPTRGPA